MRHSLILFFTLVAFSATAQVYKPFKVNVSLGYAKAIGQGLSGGVLFSLEPKYGLSDHFDLGLRLEGASIARGITVGSNNQTFTANAVAFGSTLLTGSYLFGTKNSFRPFLGLGAGIYTIGASDTFQVVNGQGPENIAFTSETKFGFMVRAGFKTGHFLVGVEYNAVPTTAVKLSNTTIDSKNSYLGIKIGVDIGGGKL